MTRFGDLARRRISQREEEGRRAATYRELEVLMDMFQERSDSANVIWSAEMLNRRTKRLADLLTDVAPEYSGERKGDILQILQRVESRFRQAPVSLDSLSAADVPVYDPTEELPATYANILADIVQDRTTNFLFNDLFYNQRHKLSDVQDKPVNEFFSFAYWLTARALLHGFETIPSFIETLLLYYPDASELDAMELKKAIKADNLLKMTDTREFIRKLHSDHPDVFHVVGGMLQTYSDAVRSERSVLTKADRLGYEVGVLPDDPVSDDDLRKRDLFDLERRIINAYRSCGNYHRVAKAFVKGKMPVYEMLIQNGVMETHGGSRQQRDYAAA